MDGLIIVGVFLVCLFLNVPVAISLGVASMVFLLFFSPLSVDLVVQSLFAGLDSFTLLAVPFFILAGDIMLVAGISDKLIKFCSALIGKVAGALGMVCVLASAIFAAISGSGPATVACIGGIVVPAMIREKYDRAFSATLASCAGALGPIIPPSLSFIVYGVVSGQSITSLFLAGVIPGLLMAALLMWYSNYAAKKYHFGTLPNKSENEKTATEEKKGLWASFKDAFWALLVPGIILGGIYGGVFTPTEAAVVASDYALIIGLFVYKTIKLKDLPVIFTRTILTTGTCLILVACATAFGRLLTMARVPYAVADFMLSISSNVYVILLLINVFLFIVGMLMETLAAIIILTPILLPVVTKLGVDPLHFGVIIVVNLVIGMCTPPVGVNLFVGSRLANIRIEDMVRWLLPMVGLCLVALLLVTYIPAISMFLPNLVK